MIKPQLRKLKKINFLHSAGENYNYQQGHMFYKGSNDLEWEGSGTITGIYGQQVLIKHASFLCKSTFM